MQLKNEIVHFNQRPAGGDARVGKQTGGVEQFVLIRGPFRVLLILSVLVFLTLINLNLYEAPRPGCAGSKWFSIISTSSQSAGST